MIYLKLIWSYLKIGLFGFGGGYAMLTLIEREIVGHGWLTSTAFTDIVAISQMTPGPIGINSATYIGYMAPGMVEPRFAGPLWGLLGSVICTLTVVLPSYLLVLYASHFVRRHKDSLAIQGIFKGLRPVTIGSDSVGGAAADERRQFRDGNPGYSQEHSNMRRGVCRHIFC